MYYYYYPIIIQVKWWHCCTFNLHQPVIAHISPLLSRFTKVLKWLFVTMFYLQVCVRRGINRRWYGAMNRSNKYAHSLQAGFLVQPCLLLKGKLSCFLHVHPLTLVHSELWGQKPPVNQEHQLTRTHRWEQSGVSYLAIGHVYWLVGEQPTNPLIAGRYSRH